MVKKAKADHQDEPAHQPPSHPRRTTPEKAPFPRRTPPERPRRTTPEKQNAQAKDQNGAPRRTTPEKPLRALFVLFVRA